MLVNGVDLIEIERVKRAIARHGDRFLRRIYTPGELAHCGMRHESLAGRYALKEAVAKALGTGIGDISWQEIEIVSHPNGRPELLLHGAAAELAKTLGISQWAISMSHSNELAIGYVVGL